MNEIVQIIIYIIGVAIAFFCLWFVDFNKFIRVDKREAAMLVYFVISIVIGFLLGHFLITIGTLFQSAVS